MDSGLGHPWRATSRLRLTLTLTAIVAVVMAIAAGTALGSAGRVAFEPRGPPPGLPPVPLGDRIELPTDRVAHARIDGTVGGHHVEHLEGTPGGRRRCRCR